MKKKNTDMTELTVDEVVEHFSNKKSSRKGLFLKTSAVLLAVTLIVCAINSMHRVDILELDPQEYEVVMAPNPAAATASKKNVIAIPTGIVKANPFLPYRNLGDDETPKELINDVPKFDLIAPPEMLNENSEAAKIMNTVVSGILYDKYSPSAILNIEGNDYLVKKGDVVNNYKVLAIAQDSVTVQFGKNTFKAGIGEILTDGTVNYNEVSNLSKKFGGEKR